MKKILFIYIAIAMVFSSCTDLLSPASENQRELSDIYTDASFAEGLLINAYIKLPSGSYSFDDVATDNAVSNDRNNRFMLLATGRWSSSYNPQDRWADAFSVIQYLNILLAEADKVNWSSTGKYVKEMFNDRIKGEAYGMRGLYLYYLLQAHAGKSADGKILGVPILTTVQDPKSDFRIPRNTFEECVQQIYKDLDMAESLLPLDYMSITNAEQIPSKYAGKTTISDYDRVCGEYFRQRLSSRIIKGIRAKVSLLAASPAFSDGSVANWTKAADAAANVIDINGGVSGIAPRGVAWYSRKNVNEINAIANGSNPAEILWRTTTSLSNDREQDNYPPSLYGSGRVNPTQNLVDAFPMANGYPIADSRSGYDANNPYQNRDPRLSEYITVDGSRMGPNNTIINTKVDNTGDDGLNRMSKSTRTGYYLRKLLREDVNLSPGNTNTQTHYIPHIRYTEIYLNYAEAANEAFGPDGKGTHSYSARDVIGAIRKRAGIAQPDNFLASISTKEDMRTLIHNERRLELCFEGFRFWDLRRWKEDITAPAKGISINANGSYQVNTVEARAFSEFMYYGPLPYTEVLKWGLTQNTGW